MTGNIMIVTCVLKQSMNQYRNKQWKSRIDSEVIEQNMMGVYLDTKQKEHKTES